MLLRLCSFFCMAQDNEEKKICPHHNRIHLHLSRSIPVTIAVPVTAIATDDIILFTVNTESSLGISIRSFICTAPLKKTKYCKLLNSEIDNDKFHKNKPL